MCLHTRFCILTLFKDKWECFLEPPDIFPDTLDIILCAVWEDGSTLINQLPCKYEVHSLRTHTPATQVEQPPTIPALREGGRQGTPGVW